MTGMACLHTSIWLRRLTAIIWSQTSMPISVTVVSRASTSAAVSAALLSTKSMPPKRSTTAPTIAATWSSSPRSTVTARPSPPAAPTSSATRTAPAASRSATTTDAPSAASVSATVRPMPPAPPVTIATLPANRSLSPIRRTVGQIGRERSLMSLT